MQKPQEALQARARVRSHTITFSPQPTYAAIIEVWTRRGPREPQQGARVNVDLTHPQGGRRQAELPLTAVDGYSLKTIVIDFPAKRAKFRVQHDQDILEVEQDEG